MYHQKLLQNHFLHFFSSLDLCFGVDLLHNTAKLLFTSQTPLTVNYNDRGIKSFSTMKQKKLLDDSLPPLWLVFAAWMMVFFFLCKIPGKFNRIRENITYPANIPEMQYPILLKSNIFPQKISKNEQECLCIIEILVPFNTKISYDSKISQKLLEIIAVHIQILVLLSNQCYSACGN